MKNFDTRKLEEGGLVLFSGGTSFWKAGLQGALLSFLITRITNSLYSHSAIVPPLRYWSRSRPVMVHSSIVGPVSGPQIGDLETILDTEYASQGGRAVFLPFQDGLAPDWEPLWEKAGELIWQQKIGRLHYSVLRLFCDADCRSWLFSALPLDGIIQHLTQEDKGLVCSECAGLLMQAGGVDAKARRRGIAWLAHVTPVPGQPIGCAPQDLKDMPLYGVPVALL